jgi:uroporphyrinogen III methyltransferase/synthase
MTGTLAGREILITRSKTQVSSFSRLLSAAGATVLEVPTIEIRPRPTEELDLVARAASRYDWMFLTSANAAVILLDRMLALGLQGEADTPPICTIGPATARAVRDRGWKVDLVPSTYQAEGIIEDFLGMLGKQIKGIRIIIPRASRAREILPEALTAAGALVDVIPIYDTVDPEGGAEQLRSVLDNHTPDLVTFTSSSTVHNFVRLAADHPKVELLKYASIGPITTETALSYDLQVVVQPKHSTVPALAEAIEDYFEPKTG